MDFTLVLPKHCSLCALGWSSVVRLGDSSWQWSWAVLRRAQSMPRKLSAVLSCTASTWQQTDLHFQPVEWTAFTCPAPVPLIVPEIGLLLQFFSQSYFRALLKQMHPNICSSGELFSNLCFTSVHTGLFSQHRSPLKCCQPHEPPGLSLAPFCCCTVSPSHCCGRNLSSLREATQHSLHLPSGIQQSQALHKQDDGGRSRADV